MSTQTVKYQRNHSLITLRLKLQPRLWKCRYNKKKNESKTKENWKDEISQRNALNNLLRKSFYVLCVRIWQRNSKRTRKLQCILAPKWIEIYVQMPGWNCTSDHYNNKAGCKTCVDKNISEHLLRFQYRIKTIGKIEQKNYENKKTCQNSVNQANVKTSTKQRICFSYWELRNNDMLARRILKSTQWDECDWKFVFFFFLRWWNGSDLKIVGCLNSGPFMYKQNFNTLKSF